MRSGPLLPTSLTIAALLALTGCGAAADWDSPRPAPAAVGTPGPGFLPTPTPSPEATVNPPAGSWEGVRAPAGYRVVLLTAGEASTARTLSDAVRSWAEDDGVDLREVDASDDLVAGIVSAMEMGPELIISVGDQLIDPLATVSANHLDELFLVLGAEVPEPTENVTNVEWDGASFRGEGVDAASEYDESSFTPERGDQAVRAGTTAVLTGMTGVTLWLG